MTSLFRLLALSLLLGLALPAVANEKISKDDLDAQKEVLQLKIDNNRELVEKSLDGFKSRIDALDKRIDDQNNRVGDIGQSVDRFSLIVGILALLVTVLLTLGGLVGYFSVAKKAAEEAESASKKWFDDNHEKLAGQIYELEKAAEQAYQNVAQLEKQASQKINNIVNDVEARGKDVFMPMQTGGLIASNEQAQPISPTIEPNAQQQNAEPIEERPEASYSFEDWNKRAFDAYRSEQLEDAALYWKRASSIANAGASNTAQALLNRAITLNQLERYGEACTTYEKLIATYSPDNTPAIREQVARAMLNMGATLGQMQKPAEAITTYEKLIATYSPDAPPAILEQVAKAMNNMGVAFGQMQKLAEALATFEKLIATYSSDNTPTIRGQIARAMTNKGITLGKMQKPADEIAIYEKLIATYFSDNTPTIREQVAIAMSNMGTALEQQKKPAEAIATYEKLVATYSSDNTPAIREQVARAMNNMGVVFGQTKKLAEAIATFEKLIATYSPDNTPVMREQVARAMNNKGIALGKMQKPAEAIATYGELIADYSSDDTPAIRKQIAIALNTKGFLRLMDAKKSWNDRDRALALLREAQADLRASFEQRTDCGVVRGNLAYVQWLLGDRQAAEESFRAALAAAQNGGKKLYLDTLDDIATHPIKEDSAFRNMIERQWAEYKTVHSSGD